MQPKRFPNRDGHHVEGHLERAGSAGRFTPGPEFYRNLPLQDQPPRCDGIKKCLMVSGAAHLVTPLQCSELSGAQKTASCSNYS
ncbi:hypothetical protein ACFXTO_015279 [Malus domestica]